MNDSLFVAVLTCSSQEALHQFHRATTVKLSVKAESEVLWENLQTNLFLSSVCIIFNCKKNNKFLGLLYLIWVSLC